MTVALNSKDLILLDKDLAAESQVWEVLKGGSKDITEADFVSANEVRINVMKGFTATDYKRNQDNGRNVLEVQKETLKLTQERFMAYDFDQLDQEENPAASIANAVEEHARLVAVPEKDRRAVSQLFANAGKQVQETVTTKNALASFDAAEQYFTDKEVSGPFVMFVSSDYYAALKNADGVSKVFTTDNVLNVSGVNRKVAQLDTDTPIIKVAKSRLQVADGKKINFIMVPLNVAAPVEKYNTVDIVPASQDRNGYRDTLKGLNYYDLIVTDKAKPAIYVSYDNATATPTV